MPIPSVNRSARTRTPSAAATAGFTYVITVARTGPISPISAKNRRNATAVQTTASPITDASAAADGVSSGRRKAAIGAYTIVVSRSDSAITPSAGRPASHRWRMAGPTA